MAASSVVTDIYLPEFLSSVKYCMKSYPSMSTKETLDHSFNMTKKMYPRMKESDKRILFKHIYI